MEGEVQYIQGGVENLKFFHTLMGCAEVFSVLNFQPLP